MENRTNIEWNKDDIDALGFLKIDVLALGMLTCIRKTFDLAKQHYGLELTLANIPQDDPAVYEMVGHADTIGVFQIESRAQQSMLPRLKPKTFYDLVIEVAIVRPGPIQGDMVHPYLRRRNGEEPVTYPSKDLEEILGRTLGVPLFQEQVMKIAIVAAGFTPAEADELRRSMATFKMKGTVNQFEKRLIEGMLERGYSLDFATRIMRQLEGFGAYGFPESHAASFALLVYVSCWIKCYYPDIFCAALLNSQPMGFYQPAQLVADAKKHGVEMRPIDINHSFWDNTLEEQAGKYKAMRLGFRLVKGMKEEDMVALTAARQQPYTSITALVDAGVSLAAIERLADADAFRSIGLDRRKALFEVYALRDRPVGIYIGQNAAGASELGISLPVMALSEHVVHDYGSTSLSLKAHPVGFVREKLISLNVLTTQGLNDCQDGQWVKVSGLVLVRQRPGTAAGVCFITIEDETGFANLVVWASLFETYRKEILRATFLMVEGKLQREGEVTHVIVSKCHDMSRMLKQRGEAEDNHRQLQTLSAADNNDGTFRDERKPDQSKRVYQGEIFGQGRNFK